MTKMKTVKEGKKGQDDKWRLGDDRSLSPSSLRVYSFSKKNFSGSWKWKRPSAILFVEIFGKLLKTPSSFSPGVSSRENTSKNIKKRQSSYKQRHNANKQINALGSRKVYPFSLNFEWQKFDKLFSCAQQRIVTLFISDTQSYPEWQQFW